MDAPTLALTLARGLLRHPDVARFKLRGDVLCIDATLVEPDELSFFAGRDVAVALDRRYEECGWRSEPADHVLEKLRGSVALVGAPGCGKTTLLKWLARRPDRFNLVWNRLAHLFNLVWIRLAHLVASGLLFRWSPVLSFVIECGHLIRSPAAVWHR